MLQSTAQIVLEDPDAYGHDHGGEPIQLEILDSSPLHMDHPDMPQLTVHDDAPQGDHDADLHVEIDLNFPKEERLPGAPGVDPDENIIVVNENEESDKEEEKKKDSAKAEDDMNDARKSKKSEKWDWESKGAQGFLPWIKARMNDVPKHSGYDTAGLERAIAYLERLDTEISKAMRNDVDGELDANKVESVRSQLDNGLEMLYDRVQKVKESKKGKKGKKRADFENGPLVKEGQKITGVQGIYVTVPLLISRVARVCINGMVSAGHDIEDIYAKQVKKYKLSEREQAETMQLLSDMGYALRQDRGYMPDEEVDISSSDNMDWAANYRG